MSAIPIAITAQDVAKGLSMFEIDESLEALVEAAAMVRFRRTSKPPWRPTPKRSDIR